MQILIIEDDHAVAHDIIEGLEDARHGTTHVTEMIEGQQLARSRDFDAIILDRMLTADMDSLQLLKDLRLNGIFTPVLLISGLGTVDDKVQGLNAGANAYLAKPFALQELVARVDALNLPRRERGVATELWAGDVHVDRLSRIVTRAGRRIDLQPREYKLLEYLLRHAGQVVTRKQLLEAVWNTRFDPGTAVIEVHLSRLRKKLDSPFEQSVLHTIRNVGFMFRAAEGTRPLEKPLRLGVRKTAEPPLAFVVAR